MKTFKEEYYETYLWLIKELRKNETMDVEHKDGYDGGKSHLDKSAFDEYRKRLQNAKEKYSVFTDEQVKIALRNEHTKKSKDLYDEIYRILNENKNR